MLSSINWPVGVNKLVIDQVDSTMMEANRRENEIIKPTWILAKHQTDAYGRKGRYWENPKGNFSATLAMKLNEPLASLALRSFVAALALFDTLTQVTQRAELFSLKWPNDILMDFKKVSGILLESSNSRKETKFLKIGIGVNLVSLPKTLTESYKQIAEPISLEDFCFKIGPEDFLVYLASNFAYWETQLEKFGFQRVRRVWLDRAYGVGEMILARTFSEEHKGIFDTIDESGNLVLKLKNGIRVIHAGDIYFEESQCF